MRWHQLLAGWEVVAEVGHSDRVTGLHVDDERGIVCSGGDDGFVYVRALDDRGETPAGRSVRPPVHTAAVRAIVAVPEDRSRLLLFTRRVIEGLDLVTGVVVPIGGFGPVPASELDGELDDEPDGDAVDDARVAVPCDDAIVVGTGNGETWRIGRPMAEIASLAELGAPVVALAAGHRDGAPVAVAGSAAGEVVCIDLADGRVLWRVLHLPGEVLSLAVGSDTVAIGGVGPAPRSGRIVQRSLADGTVAEVVDRPLPVTVLAAAPGGRFLDGADELGAPAGSEVSALTVDAAGRCWWGTTSGAVGCTGDGPQLASRSSRVVAVALRDDEEELATVDGHALLRWAPRSGERLLEVPAPGAIAVGYAGLDPVVGFADGRIARVDVATGAVVAQTISSCGALRALGSFGGLVVAFGRRGIECFDEVDLTPAGDDGIPAAFLDGVGVVERDGAWFHSRGTVAGWRVLFVDGDLAAIVRPGVFAVADRAVDDGVVRLWDGTRFLDAALASRS